METVPRESYSWRRGTLDRGVRAKNAACGILDGSLDSLETGKAGCSVLCLKSHRLCRKCLMFDQFPGTNPQAIGSEGAGSTRSQKAEGRGYLAEAKLVSDTPTLAFSYLGGFQPPPALAGTLFKWVSRKGFRKVSLIQSVSSSNGLLLYS